jgi:hypothetical protein
MSPDIFMADISDLHWGHFVNQGKTAYLLGQARGTRVLEAAAI